MDISAFITSLGTSFLIFLALLTLHALLSRRPGNASVYYPRKKAKKILPLYSPGIFSWLREAWSVSEDEIIKQAGLDAAIYMKFLASAFCICMYTAIFCVPILLPVSITDRNFELEKKKNATLVYTKFDEVAMGNVQDESRRLWAYVIGAYWLTITTLFILWKAYKHVVQRRFEHQSDCKTGKPEQYAILVRDIPVPAAGTLTEEVEMYFRSLYPETYETSIIITNAFKASRLWREKERVRKRLVHAEAVNEKKKTRPTHRNGILGLFRPPVDSIDYYRAKKERLEAALKEEEVSIAKSTSQKGAAIVIFKNRAAATNASQVRHSLYANKWTTCAAPEPREVIWTNLAIPFVQRRIRQVTVYFAVSLTILFYMIPIAIASAIISLDNLKLKLPFLAPLVDIPAVNAVLQAFLPHIVLIFFILILPGALLKISTMEGILSKSHRDRAAAGKFFYFNVFNIFLGVTIAGSLFASLKGIINHPKSIVALLSESLPGQANFFISFVALRFFVGYGLTLSRIIPLIRFHVKKRIGWIMTKHEIAEACAPKSFRYATRVPGDMLVLTITLCYAVIAPLILVFAIIYFGLGWLLMRNQALNVMVPKYESGGRMWPHIHSRIVASLLLSQLTMLGYFGVKKFVYVPLLLPPLVATLIFAYICREFFYPSFNATPLYATCAEPTDTPFIESIVQDYTPAFLATELSSDVEEARRGISDCIIEFMEGEEW